MVYNFLIKKKRCKYCCSLKKAAFLSAIFIPIFFIFAKINLILHASDIFYCSKYKIVKIVSKLSEDLCASADISRWKKTNKSLYSDAVDARGPRAKNFLIFSLWESQFKVLQGNCEELQKHLSVHIFLVTNCVFIIIFTKQM